MVSSFMGLYAISTELKKMKVMKRICIFLATNILDIFISKYIIGTSERCGIQL